MKVIYTIRRMYLDTRVDEFKGEDYEYFSSKKKMIRRRDEILRVDNAEGIRTTTGLTDNVTDIITYIGDTAEGKKHKFRIITGFAPVN